MSEPNETDPTPSDDAGQGPFRVNAKEPDPATPWSIPAVLTLPFVTFGWFSAWLLAEGTGDGWLYASAAGLLLGGVLGLVGLTDTRPVPEHAGSEDLPLPKRGRTAAKLGLGCLIGPIVLGCLFFGLILLTCMGH